MKLIYRRLIAIWLVVGPLLFLSQIPFRTNNANVIDTFFTIFTAWCVGLMLAGLIVAFVLGLAQLWKK
jgi:hypothetical protein